MQKLLEKGKKKIIEEKNKEATTTLWRLNDEIHYIHI